MADMKGVKLSGTVEVDETYIGGKPRYKKQSQRGRVTRKQPVIGMFERSGQVRARVIPDVTTNTIESFFAIFKRGLIGVCHNVSRQHLQRYLDEFEFRYNTRKVDDGERTVKAIQSGIGKRLYYRQPEAV